MQTAASTKLLKGYQRAKLLPSKFIH